MTWLIFDQVSHHLIWDHNHRNSWVFHPTAQLFSLVQEEKGLVHSGFTLGSQLHSFFQLAPNLFHFASVETPTSLYLRWVYTRCHFLTGFVALFYALRTWISQSLYIVGTDHHSLVIPLLSRDPEKRCYYLVSWLIYLQSSWCPIDSSLRPYQGLCVKA